MSAATANMPSVTDVKNLTTHLKDAQVIVQGALKSAQASAVAANLGGIPMNLAFPLITENGPEVIVQQV
jgi:hypothetical protein